MTPHRFDHILLLDREHLDQSFFMKSLARELAARQKRRWLILHADSALTDRIMQEGVMREDAAVRAAKELNHRMVTLLADAGIPALAFHPEQMGLVRRQDRVEDRGEGRRQGHLPDTHAFDVQIEAWNRLPDIPVVVLSSLFDGAVVPLYDLSDALVRAFPSADRILFSRVDSLQWGRVDLPEQLLKTGSMTGLVEFEALHLPVEFRGRRGFRLCALQVPGPASLDGGALAILD
jgi:hypothetical protein